jgi:hypothetical protein
LHRLHSAAFGRNQNNGVWVHRLDEFMDESPRSFIGDRVRSRMEPASAEGVRIPLLWTVFVGGRRLPVVNPRNVVAEALAEVDGGSV